MFTSNSVPFVPFVFFASFVADVFTAFHFFALNSEFWRKYMNESGLTEIEPIF
jgi:hypothetical protein